jgi:hypothetical protein
MEPAPSAVYGLLVSQIGYDAAGVQRALLRVPPGTAFALSPGYEITGESGEIVRHGVFTCWGRTWGSDWWEADFSLPKGRYTIRATGVPELADVHETFPVGEDLLYRGTWEYVALEQMETRVHFAPSKCGWQDCGAALQEANSHASCVIGLCDLLELRRGEMTPAQIERLETQIMTGNEYLVRCQERCAELGMGEGGLIHGLITHETMVLTGDVSKAIIAWAMSVRLLKGDGYTSAFTGEKFAGLRARFRTAATRAMRWLATARPPGPDGWLACVHGAPEDYVPPQEWMTHELVLNAWSALELAAIGEAVWLERAFADMRRIAGRQIPPGERQVHGHFRLFDDGPLIEVSWSHHLPKGVVGADVGASYPNYLMPFLLALRRYPEHADAALWRGTLERFAFGYLVPACRTNPFGIIPLGDFPEEGLLSFAGAWHGFNSAYALTAALALELDALFPCAELRELAHRNVLWIAGLNAGLTQENIAGCVVWKRDVTPGRALPVSMINSVGKRWAGAFFNVRGAVVNGFSTGKQFVWDVPPKKEFDAPSSFTDEDWITHGGAWLSAVSRATAGWIGSRSI